MEMKSKKKNSLTHHGVLGMKWGVRRYQNYDGSYTAKGLEHYNKNLKNYEHQAKKVKDAKVGIKAGTHTKADLVNAKIARNQAKRQLSKSYDALKRDYNADKGREAYANGKTITSNENRVRHARNVANVAGTLATIGGWTAYSMYRRGYTSEGKKLLLGSAALMGTAIVGTHALNAVTEHQNNQLRAYYAHKLNTT